MYPAAHFIYVNVLLLFYCSRWDYLMLYTVTHNFKWKKITDICLIWDQTFINLGV